MLLHTTPPTISPKQIKKAKIRHLLPSVVPKIKATRTPKMENMQIRKTKKLYKNPARRPESMVSMIQ